MRITRKRMADRHREEYQRLRVEVEMELYQQLIVEV